MVVILNIYYINFGVSYLLGVTLSIIEYIEYLMDSCIPFFLLPVRYIYTSYCIYIYLVITLPLRLLGYAVWWYWTTVL